MSWTCSMAVVVQLLGFTPAPGSTVTVPAHMAARFEPHERSAAKACARRLGFRLVMQRATD